MRRFWYFDVSVWSVDRKPYHSRLCQNSDFTPYCNLYLRTLYTCTPQTYSSVSNFHEYYSDTPSHPSDTSQTPPRYPLGTWNANRQQQMPRNTARLSQTAPVSFLGSLGMSDHKKVSICSNSLCQQHGGEKSLRYNANLGEQPGLLRNTS